MFDIIAISESKLKNDPKVDISLKGYHPPYCTNTEAENGGTILYVTSISMLNQGKTLKYMKAKSLNPHL